MEATNITTVHLIQSNHLDVGYTNTARNVINQYFTSFFPRAIKVGQDLRAKNGTERLKWMTQTYLVSLYLNCPDGLGLTCPTASEISAFKASVAAGDITYQAFPHNAELMMVDPSMLTFGVKLTHDIDDALGQTHKTVVSDRDVPGFERSIIPILKKAGVTGLSMGMNGRIFPVNVPSAFVWRDEGAIKDSVNFADRNRNRTISVKPPSGEVDMVEEMRMHFCPYTHCIHHTSPNHQVRTFWSFGTPGGTETWVITLPFQVQSALTFYTFSAAPSQNHRSCHQPKRSVQAAAYTPYQ
jgi:hypothetical protein